MTLRLLLLIILIGLYDSAPNSDPLAVIKEAIARRNKIEEAKQQAESMQNWVTHLIYTNYRHNNVSSTDHRINVINSRPSVTVNYTLDSPYYERDRVYKANCRVRFHRFDLIEKYETCFMEGQRTIGCFVRILSPKWSSKWQYNVDYRPSKLTVLEGDVRRGYGISIKGLEPFQETHCQVNVFTTSPLTSLISFPSAPASLTHSSSNDSVSHTNDTTVVRISRHEEKYGMRFNEFHYVYTCKVAFSDDQQYDEQTTKISLHLKGFVCTMYSTGPSPYEPNIASNVTHHGGNVYSARFKMANNEYECQVKLSDGRTYKSPVSNPRNPFEW